LVLKKETDMYEFKKGYAVKRLKDGVVFEIIEVVGAKKSPKDARFHGSLKIKSYLMEYRHGAISKDLRVFDCQLRDGTWQVFPKGIEDAKSTCVKGKVERDGSISCFGNFLDGQKACSGCQIRRFCVKTTDEMKSRDEGGVMLAGFSFDEPKSTGAKEEFVRIGSVFLGLNTRTHWEVIKVDYPNYLTRNVEDPSQTVWVQYRDLTDTTSYVPEDSLKGVGIPVGAQYRRTRDDTCWKVVEFVPSNFYPSHPKAKMLGTRLTPTYVLEMVGGPNVQPVIDLVYAYEMVDPALFVLVEKKDDNLVELRRQLAAEKLRADAAESRLRAMEDVLRDVLRDVDVSLSFAKVRLGIRR
jgi:hypothetical protein